LQPECVLELGTHAGSGAHAYLHGAPNARYIGYDVFGSGQISAYDGKPWQPFEIATALLTELGASFQLVKGDLRQVHQLPPAALRRGGRGARFYECLPGLPAGAHRQAAIHLGG
jgi:hypothetical protein